MCKIIAILSLAWLRRTARRWRSGAGAAGATSLRGPGKLEKVPAGHVAVRVLEGGRFVVRLAQLNHPAFRELLRRAEEEYGFPPGASGPVELPCDEDQLRDVLRRVSSEGRRPFCGGRGAARARRGDSRPLLQGMAVEKLVW